MRNSLACTVPPGSTAKLGWLALAWKAIADCSTSVPSSGRNTALARRTTLEKSRALVTTSASPPADTPSRVWRGRPPSQPPAWAGSRLAQSALPESFRAWALSLSSMSSGGVLARWPTVFSIPPIQNGKPGFFRVPSAFRLASLRSTRATEPTATRSVSSVESSSSSSSLSSSATRVSPYLGTTLTLPGMGGMALPGSGTMAGIGVPAMISPSGRARAPGAGRPLRSSKGFLWKPSSPSSDTARRVPSSNTSWMRHMPHMPWAKCG
ncbi:hypothetical protein D9M71_413480 [compost metagenome]